MTSPAKPGARASSARAVTAAEARAQGWRPGNDRPLTTVEAQIFAGLTFAGPEPPGPRPGQVDWRTVKHPLKENDEDDLCGLCRGSSDDPIHRPEAPKEDR